MGRLVNLNGVLVPPDRAFISVFDRGFLFGDSVTEQLQTEGGRLQNLEAHLDLLWHAAARVGLVLPLVRSELVDRLVRTLAIADLAGEATARVIVTRGSGGQPSVLILVEELPPPSGEAFELGARVVLTAPERMAQSLGMAGAVAVQVEPDGSLAGCSPGCVFVVSGGLLATPALASGRISEVDRARVIELALALGLTVAERPVPATELEAASEAFLSSGTWGALPITAVGTRSLGLGSPGPVTRRLAEAHRLRSGRRETR